MTNGLMTPDEVIATISKLEHIPVACLRAGYGTPDMATGRYLAAHVMRQLGYRHKVIARAMGWADRKSSERAATMVAKRIVEDRVFAERVEALEQECGVWS